jgi:hypothetical protein
VVVNNKKDGSQNPFPAFFDPQRSERRRFGATHPWLSSFFIAKRRSCSHPGHCRSPFYKASAARSSEKKTVKIQKVIKKSPAPKNPFSPDAINLL